MGAGEGDAGLGVGVGIPDTLGQGPPAGYQQAPCPGCRAPLLLRMDTGSHVCPCGAHFRYEFASGDWVWEVEGGSFTRFFVWVRPLDH